MPTDTYLKLPSVRTLEDYEELLPWNVKTAYINSITMCT